MEISLPLNHHITTAKWFFFLDYIDYEFCKEKKKKKKTPLRFKNVKSQKKLLKNKISIP